MGGEQIDAANNAIERLEAEVQALKLQLHKAREEAKRQMECAITAGKDLAAVLLQIRELQQIRDKAVETRDDYAAKLEQSNRLIDELKGWIWDQGHIRVASHRVEDCARCKLEAKEGATQKPKKEVGTIGQWDHIERADEKRSEPSQNCCYPHTDGLSCCCGCHSR